MFIWQFVSKLPAIAELTQPIPLLNPWIAGGEQSERWPPRSPPTNSYSLRSRLVRFPGGNQADLQPPLPLQLFLPLQPISPVWQPPCPLQVFKPLQSCFSIAAPDDAAALPELSEELLQPVMAMEPATNPAMAAEMTNVLAVLVIIISCCSLLMLIFHPLNTVTRREVIRFQVRRDSEWILTNI